MKPEEIEDDYKEEIKTCPTCGSHVPTYKGEFIPIFIEVIRLRLFDLKALQEEKQQLISALEASQRDAEELRKILKDAPTHEDMDALVFQVNVMRAAYSRVLENALGCENCFEDAQALGRTEKEGGWQKES